MKTYQRFLNGKALLTLLFVCAFSLGALLPINVNSVFASTPACTNSGCDDKDPQTYVPAGTTACSADAINSGELTKGSMLVQRRVSNACQAKWERTKHTGTTSDSLFMAGTLYWGSTLLNSYNVRTSIAVAPGSVIYTHMKGNYQRSFACGMVSYGLLSVPVTISDNNCPVNQP